MIDVQMKFQPTVKSLVAATVNQISDNVYDAASAVKVFEGYSHHAPRLSLTGKVTAGAATQVRARLVGADDAALTTNVVTIADTGLGEVIANGASFHKECVCNGQVTAKRYYGILFDTAGAAGTADVVGTVEEAPQSNMPYQKAAVP